MPPKTSFFPAFALSSILLLGAAPASASGLLVARFGGEAGHPTTDDLTAMYYNPAGLALKPGRLRITVNGVMALRFASYERPAGAIDNVVPMGTMGTGTPEEAISGNAGRASLLNFIVSPFIGVSTDLGQKGLGVGLSYYVPFGGQASWNRNSEYSNNATYPGAVDGIQRWATIDGIIRSHYITAAIAYRIAPARLSIGVSGNIVINEVSTVRARNANGSDDLVNSQGSLQEGRSLLDAKNVTGSIGVGAIWQPTTETWLGLSYQSQPGFGETTLSGELKNKLGNSAVQTQKIEIKQSLPDVLRIGGRFRPQPNMELRVFGEWVRWSALKRQCVLDSGTADRSCKLNADGSLDTANGGSGVILNIDRQWQDAFGFRVGASWWVRPNVEIFLGGGYDGNAVPDVTLEPSIIDMEKLSASIGTRVELLKGKLAINATYTQVFYFDRIVNPRPHDASGKTIAPSPPSRSPDMAGTYKQQIGLLSLALELAF